MVAIIIEELKRGDFAPSDSDGEEILYVAAHRRHTAIAGRRMFHLMS